MFPLPNVTPCSVRSFEKFYSSTSVRPTVQDISSTDFLHVMTDIHYWFVLPHRLQPFHSLFLSFYFSRSCWESPKFSSGLPLFGVLHTFEMFETCRFRRKRFWLWDVIP
ncbi:hypothetical protein CDAR_426541 [Caerostris darwini]|uniref:Uncharacterized protein n=1 Tax=Caerostris darwini TaxID=1538125 RepID=A0AAV4N6E6_9ARAC|nr:hypothetical protein CDAR_426541 [Caerostris darwini]